MPRYRFQIAMAQNGRSSRDTHKVVFLASPTGAFDRAKARQLSLDVVAALAAVTFTNTNFLRATFALLQANGLAVKNGSFSIPMSATGHEVFDAGDGAAHENVCLAIEKSSQYGKAGVSLLRHVLSADEYAEYLNTATIPARFTASPAGTYNVGHSIGDNLQKAFADNDFDMLLPPIVVNNVVTERPVTTIAAQDFRMIKATKTRHSAAWEVARGVQRELNEMARQAWKLWNKFIGGVAPADVITAIRAIITAASSAYNALAAVDRVLVTPPQFPALPAP